MLRPRAVVVLGVVSLLCLGGTVVPVQAAQAPGPAESYLFVVDSPSMKITPRRDAAARIVIERPRSLRFSDRPYRHEQPLSTRELLAELDWETDTHRLGRPTPNASLSIDGRSQVVDIRKAEVHGDRLILSVRGIDGPLRRAQGAGSLFIDNATDYPGQALVDGLPYSMTVTRTGTSTVTVTLYSYDEVVSTLDLTAPAQSVQLTYLDEAGMYIFVFIDVTLDANVVTTLVEGTLTYGSEYDVGLTFSS